jgi:hypothetical protein
MNPQGFMGMIGTSLGFFPSSTEATIQTSTLPVGFRNSVRGR